MVCNRISKNRKCVSQSTRNVAGLETTLKVQARYKDQFAPSPSSSASIVYERSSKVSIAKFQIPKAILLSEYYLGGALLPQTPPEIPWGAYAPPRPPLKWLRQGVLLANFYFYQQYIFRKFYALRNRVYGVQGAGVEALVRAQRPPRDKVSTLRRRGNLSYF